MNTSTPHALYRFYSDDGALLYVGITLNPVARWTSHRQTKLWWTDVTRITIEHHSDRLSALDAERHAIQTEHPTHNVIHNRGSSDAIDIFDVVLGPRFGATADTMPDLCQDCYRAGAPGHDDIYYPYAWVRGHASYQCANNHTWTCTWGHSLSGRAEDHLATPAVEVRP